MYCKGHQPNGMSRDPDGKHKDLNDKWSPVHGLINNKRMREAARIENEEHITKMPKDEPVISEGLAAATADTFSTCPLPTHQH